MLVELGTIAEVQKRPGVRELSKQESQHKIMVSARELFAEQGYDRSTLRQIAAKAGLTVGALFKHVSDKRDLIYFIFNEEVDALTDTALSAPRAYQTFFEKMSTMTEYFFRLFANEPVLSRILLVEIVIESPGLHLARYQAIRARFLEGMAQYVAQAQDNGEIQTDESADFIALHLFFTVQASLRRMLASCPRPEWRDGHREYERLLRLQVNGLGPKQAEEVASVGAAKGVRSRRHA